MKEKIQKSEGLANHAIEFANFLHNNYHMAADDEGEIWWMRNKKEWSTREAYQAFLIVESNNKTNEGDRPFGVHP